ncbi:MAG: hypothetical protein ACTSWN_15450 [Promethearchaeota archaeon]
MHDSKSVKVEGMDDTTTNTKRPDILDMRVNLIVQSLMMLIHSSRVLNSIYSHSWKNRTAMGIIVGLCSEVFVIIACLQYWWFGQLYLISTLILFALIFLPLWVPAAPQLSRKWRASLAWQSILLFPPALLSSVLIIVFRLGYVPYITSYLYRSPILTILALFFMLSTVMWKAWGRVALDVKSRNRKIKNAMNMMFIFIDLMIMAGITIALLNFSDILAVF